MKKNIIFFLIFILIISIGINLYFLNSKKSDSFVENKQTNLEIASNNKTAINDISDIKKIKDEKDFILFKKEYPLPESILMYSIKNNDLNKWNLYWLNAYEQFNNVGFSESEFIKYMSDVFPKVVSNKLQLDIKNKFLLDGGIFFSSGTIDEKINGCNSHHNLNRKDSDFEKYGLTRPKDIEKNIKKCINFSYYYKAVIDKNPKICTKIEDAGTGNNMGQDCLELLKK